MRLLKMVKIFLMASLLTACESFPQLHPYVLSVQNGVCGQYSVNQIDPCNVIYTFVQWLPIEQCDGFFALPPSDIVAIKDWQAGYCANNPPPTTSPPAQ